MSKDALEECYSLRDAVQLVKSKLIEKDNKNNEHRKWCKINMTDAIKDSMEEENWNDKLYLVYRNDYYDDKYYIFKDSYDIESWLGEKWSDWDLWDYSNINSFLEEELTIWEFHRNICIEKWDTLYEDSKPFINGWSRKREYAELEAVPSFNVR